MNRNHRLGFSWLAVVLCMALLMTGMPLAPAYAKSKGKKEKKETYYTIKWQVNGETVRKDKVKKGEKPEKPEDPADYTDGKYSYVFSGWEPKVAKATKDMTYKARFKKTERTFTITWLDDKGKRIDVTEVKYGKLPTHEDPKKKGTEKYTYTFAGWEPKPVKAKADAIYTATFKKEARKYKVTWVDDEGNVIDQTKVAYGEMPTHEDPVKQSAKTAYVFTGWKPKLARVTGDVTYTATFRKAERFTITWKDDAGNVIDTTQVEAGKKPTHDDPTKEPTEQYTYTFAGWEPKVVKAKADASYTATFKQKTRKYTITWLDGEGKLIDETQVAYGKLPTHADPTMAETDTSTYVFKGWEPELAKVTGDATYTAVFEEVPKAAETYTITWKDDAGNVIDTTQVEAGKKPTHDDPTKEPTEQYTYVFKGWEPKVVKAKEDATYTATFKQKTRKYTITWLDDEGKLIDETQVAYGKLPTHDDPVKAPTDTATYTFAGWQPEPVAVTADAAYTATFTENVNGEIAPETDDSDMAEGNSVVVKFEYADGTLVDYPQSYVETEESKPVYYIGAEPETAETDEFAYEWVGWTDDKDNTTVTEDEEIQYGKSRNKKEKPLLPEITVDSPAETVYYAVFREIPKHTVTWVIDDKKEETKVAEGRQPTHDDPAKQGFVFDGWLAVGGTEPIRTADLPAMGTEDVIYTAQFTADTVLYDITWVIDGVEEVTPFEAGVQPTHDDPESRREGYEFAGWKNGKEVYESDKLPVVTANATYTAQWKLPVALEDVNCYAFIKSKGERKTARDALLPATYEPDEKNSFKLDWSKATLEKYDPSKNGIKNDGTYTYVLNVPDPEDDNAVLAVTCRLIVGPKQSETVGTGKSKKENTDYEYRWDSIVKNAKKAKAIITAWKGKDIKKKKPQTLTVAATIDDMSVTAIDEEVFQGKKLSEITVPAGVTAIGRSAFAECPNLTTLTLPDSLTSIGMNLTDGSDKLEVKKLSVGLETTMDKDDSGCYTIKHVVDKKTDPENPVMSQAVTLPEGFPTDIAVAKLGKLTLDADLVIKMGHEVSDWTLVTQDQGILKAEIIWVDDAKKELKRDEVAYGEMPKFGDEDPKKDSTDGKNYIFSGWKPEVAKVTNPVTYTAQFTEQKPVELVATYNGEPLTKVYDCNKYGAYMKDGQVVYVIEALKTIKEKFKLDLADKKSKWIEGHKNVGFKLTLSEQYSSADVGDKYHFTFKVTLTGDDAAYYKLNEKDAVVTVPATITPRKVVVTPRAGLSKAYGTQDPKYPEGSWLSNDETSPLHQDLSGVPGYGVPVNTVDGKLQLSVTEAAYLMQEARLKGTKFFPGDNPWLVREEGEDAGKYKILIGGMSFGDNFTIELKNDVFTITPKNLEDANVIVKAIPNQQYTGKPITLDKEKLVVTYGTMTLVEDKDFTVKYENNTEASTDTKKAKVILTGKGNYAGTKEATFSIIKTASPTATPSSGGGSSGGYSGGSSSSGYGGFDDDDDIEEETPEEDEGEDGITWTPAPDGNIRVNEMDYGTVLFGADGLSRPFSIYTEDYVLETADEGEFEGFDDEGAPDAVESDGGEIDIGDEGDTGAEGSTLKRVVIKADPMKTATDDSGEEEILLEGTDRKRYDDLHLRLTDSIVQGLINNGVGEIVYELEQARLKMPLSALSSTIVLPADETVADEDGEGLDAEDEIEIEDEVEMDSAEDISANEADISANSADIPVDTTSAAGKTLSVDGYDIVIEQADANGLSEREKALIGDNVTLMPAYRVRVHIIPENAQQSPTGETDENGEPVTVPVTETLPENYTLPGVTLQLVPNDRYDMAPDEAQVLYVSIEPATAVENEAVDNEALEEALEAPAAGTETLEADAEASAADTEAPAEGDEALTEEIDETDVGEKMVANNPALAKAIDSDEASLTPAMFNAEDEPMKVEVEPVEDGLYVAIVPPDWDPTPYLPAPEDATGEEEFSDATDEGEIEDIGEEAGEGEVEFEDEGDEELVEF